MANWCTLIVSLMVLTISQVQAIRLVGHFDWVSDDGGHCWFRTGTMCSLVSPAGCSANHVNNPWGVGCHSDTGIALNQPTAKKRVVGDVEDSHLGVDGNVDTYSQVVQTNNPYWSVNLPGLHMVQGVRLKGGTFDNNGACVDQGTIKIWLINKTVETGAITEHLCATISGGAACNSMKNFGCENNNLGFGVKLISDAGVQQMMKVYELEVVGYQYPYTLALWKNATQSSTANGPAAKAVDGSNKTNAGSGVCSQTKAVAPNWWMVDLGRSQVVYSVSVLNYLEAAQRAYFTERLQQFSIRVGNHNNENNQDLNGLCHYQYNPVGNGASVEFQCSQPLVGRYVTLKQNYTSLEVSNGQVLNAGLTVCEVQVKGYAFSQGAPHLPSAPSSSMPDRNETSIKISWPAWTFSQNPGYGHANRYIVNYREHAKDTESWKTIDAGSQTFVIVQNLTQYTDYDFRIVMRDEEGVEGPPSPAAVFRTCEEKPHVSVAPSLTGKTENSISLRWLPWNKPNDGCWSINTYVVQFRHTGSESWSANQDAGKSNTKTITNLDPDAWYDFRIVTQDAEKKLGTPSAVGTFKTCGNPVISKLAASSFLEASKTGVSITIGCQASDSKCNSFKSKEVRVTKFGSAPSPDNSWVPAPIASNDFTVSGLLPYTNYSLECRVVNDVNLENIRSMPWQTEEGVPGMPRNLHINKSSENSLTIGWEKPKPPNGRIIFYQLTYTNKLSGKMSTEIIENFGEKNEITTTISNLEKTTLYILKVRASTSEGFGEWSSEIVGSPSNNDTDAIIGGSIGGGLALIILVVGILVGILVYRKRKGVDSSGKQIQ